MNDDGGVLGRLPRSRPGTRSEKRADAATPASPRPARPTPAKPKAAGAKPKTAGAKPKPASAKPRATRAKAGAKPPPSKPMPEQPRRERPAHSVPPAHERAGDPLTGALRAGAKVAEGGVKLAGGLTRELLRRLPRP